MTGRLPAPLAEYGPFYGMRYAYDPTDNGENAGFVYEALNMVPADPVRGGVYRRRAGDQRVTVAASNLVPQWLGVFRQRAGFRNIGIFSGEIYERGGATWTKRISTANLTGAGITLSATATCGCLTFTDQLIVNDSVNQPFMWDGTAGGGLTLLSNAPSKCYGVPTVYYGKLFFVKWVATSDQSTIVWSEENTPNTGYEAGGYSNAWTLEQSGAGGIFALAGTNTGLYYLRERGIGVIRGAVTPTFTADGVHDSIASYEGTLIPWGVTRIGEEVYFPLTQTGELCVISGGQVLNLGADVQDFLLLGALNITKQAAAEARTAWVPYYNAIAIGYNATSGQYGTSTAIFLYSIQTKRCIARWSYQYAPYQAAIAGPAMGNYYISGSHAFGLTVAAQNGGSTYTFLTPPEGSETYDPSTPAPVFSLTMAPFVAPAGQSASVNEVEQFLDVLPQNSGLATTLTLSVTESDSKMVGASVTDIGTLTIPAQDATAYRQERRAILGCNLERRNLQLALRDSGTLRNYAWGLKRVVLRGSLVPIEPETI